MGGFCVFLPVSLACPGVCTRDTQVVNASWADGVVYTEGGGMSCLGFTHMSGISGVPTCYKLTHKVLHRVVGDPKSTSLCDVGFP